MKEIIIIALRNYSNLILINVLQNISYRVKLLILGTSYNVISKSQYLKK